MRTIINKITESFSTYNFDMESTNFDWRICFNDNNSDNTIFFFELPNKLKENNIYKAKIFDGEKWFTIKDYDINNLIQKIKNLIQ